MNPARVRMGFSLVELLAVLAIIGVLMTIALPSFRRQVLKAHRSEAIQALHAMQLAQERLRSQAPVYAADPALLNLGSHSAQGRYLLRVMNASATGYTLEAIAQGAQSADQECHRFQLRVMGAQVVQSAYDHLGGGRLDACWPR